jgi:acyl-CoA synthetase (NDP forming)
VTHAGVTHVPEPQVKAWLRAFKIQMPNGCAVDLPAVAGDCLPSEAGKLRPPLVLKAFGPGVVHKSDLGAVRLGLAAASEVAAAAREMRARLAARGVAPAGFYVEEQARGGAEMIVGVVADPVFGAVLLAGLGGVWTEALGDTALRICPVTEADVRSMLSGLRGGAVLSGLRGAPAVDLDALVRLLLAVGGRGGVAEVLGAALAEFELNPVVCTPSGAVAVDARLVLAPGAGLPPAAAKAGAVRGSSPGGRGRVTDFTRLFAPRGIAVAGASARKPGFGNMFLRFYRRAGYTGKLVAVHPTAPAVDGVPAVASLADAGGEIDYALIAVPANRCADVVRSARGIPFVQVMSGGFGETGAEGMALESGLAAAARAAGARLLGPNCMGVYSPAGGQTFIGGEPGRPGRIAVISQSGGMAGEIIRAGEHRGLRFAAVATVGNSVDVTPAELLGWFGGRHSGGGNGQDVSAAGLYLEDPRDGRELFATLRELRGRLPVAALIGGWSRPGQRAAASHTGGMVNDARVWTALAAQTGIALVRSQDELIGVLDFFDQHAGRMRGGEAPAADAVLIIGPSGGASVLAADVFDDAGVAIPPLSEAARGELASLGLGAGSSLANPLEIPAGPGGRAGLISDAATAICSHHAYADLVVHLNVLSFFTFGTSAESLLGYVRCAGELPGSLDGTRVTLVLRNVDCAPPGVEGEARQLARAGGVPVYRTMEAAAAAVAAGQRFARAAAGRTAAGSPG